MATTKAVEQYKKYLDQFDLDEKQKEDLVGAMQAIAENLLTKKYLLNPTEHEKV